MPKSKTPILPSAHALSAKSPFSLEQLPIKPEPNIKILELSSITFSFED
ncbi:hypothetical protein KAU85_00400 [Candidatus Bathyarchaeota archaeon]|nr:hypothetical protein [Candidatus Bathyarchaeota archaeon]MCK4481836.1 hypothetical protein [Candidatus Bathyarchaeota archaeon]